MNIEQKVVTDIVPYTNNPRINDEAVDVVVDSIREFGFQVPIIVDTENVIIAGHTRWAAAKRLGLETVPTIVAKDLSDAKAKAFRIMDNKSAEKARWDFDKLVAEFDDLESLDCNMEALGFDLIEIEKLRLDFESPTPKYEMEDDDDDSPPFDTSSGHSTGSTHLSGDMESKKTGAPVIQYTLIFNDEDEQALWYAYLRHLKTKYPEATTISERLIEDIKENCGTL